MMYIRSSDIPALLAAAEAVAYKDAHVISERAPDDLS